MALQKAGSTVAWKAVGWVGQRAVQKAVRTAVHSVATKVVRWVAQKAAWMAAQTENY